MNWITIRIGWANIAIIPPCAVRRPRSPSRWSVFNTAIALFVVWSFGQSRDGLIGLETISGSRAVL